MWRPLARMANHDNARYLVLHNPIIHVPDLLALVVMWLVSGEFTFGALFKRLFKVLGPIDIFELFADPVTMKQALPVKLSTFQPSELLGLGFCKGGILPSNPSHKKSKFKVPIMTSNIVVGCTKNQNNLPFNYEIFSLHKPHICSVTSEVFRP